MRECFKDVKDGYLLIYDFLSHLSHRRSIATVQTRFEKNLQDTMEAVTLSVEPSKLVRPDVFASTSSSVLLVDCQEKKKKKLTTGRIRTLSTNQRCEQAVTVFHHTSEVSRSDIFVRKPVSPLLMTE